MGGQVLFFIFGFPWDNYVPNPWVEEMWEIFPDLFDPGGSGTVPVGPRNAAHLHRFILFAFHSLCEILSCLSTCLSAETKRNSGSLVLTVFLGGNMTNWCGLCNVDLVESRSTAVISNQVCADGTTEQGELLEGVATRQQDKSEHTIEAYGWPP